MTTAVAIHEATPPPAAPDPNAGLASSPLPVPEQNERTEAPAMGGPPSSVPTWSNLLFGDAAWKAMPVLPDNLVETGKIQIDFPKGLDATPVINIAPEVVQVLNAPWRFSVVIKLLGRMISYSAFERTLRNMWKPVGGWTVLDLPNDFFLVRFENESDMLDVLTGGPWKMFGHYLMMQQ